MASHIGRRKFLATLGGATAAWPLAVRAQQPAMPVVGYLQSGAPGPSASYLAALRRALSETGYVEGQILTIAYRWAEGPPAALAAKDATSTIPIVFVIGTDPVELDLVASLARPGGNLTGVSMLLTALNPKRLELLSELVPQARKIALLVNPNYSGADEMMRETQEAARAKGVQLHIVKARTEGEIDAAFATLVQLHAGALVVGNDTFFDGRREQLVEMAARHAIPAIFGWRVFAAAGGLISYGPSVASAYRQAGAYVGRILAGDKPADLPVQQPTKFELLINLKTARALGLQIPDRLLALADEVIE